MSRPEVLKLYKGMSKPLSDMPETDVGRSLQEALELCNLYISTNVYMSEVLPTRKIHPNCLTFSFSFLIESFCMQFHFTSVCIVVLAVECKAHRRHWLSKALTRNAGRDWGGWRSPPGGDGNEAVNHKAEERRNSRLGGSAITVDSHISFSSIIYFQAKTLTIQPPIMNPISPPCLYCISCRRE